MPVHVGVREDLLTLIIYMYTDCEQVNSDLRTFKDNYYYDVTAPFSTR